MLRLIYSAFLYLLTPYAILRLLWRSRRASAYRRRITERFAHFPSLDIEQSIWVHAVSLGEVILAIPMIKRLQQLYPDFSIVVTSTTPTGSAQIEKHFNKDDAAKIFHVYAPYDLPHVVNRFLSKVKPKMAIMMETELWPNIFHYCHRRAIPIVVANARLSARSAVRYQRVSWLVKPMLTKVNKVVAQSKDDGERYIGLGLPRERMVVSGSMKFDLQLPASLCESAEVLRQQWGVDRSIWIAASTHDGEDEIILQAFAEVKKALPSVLLVLVPRHPERFQKVAQLAQKQGLNVITRSSEQACQSTTDVFLGDTMGELTLFYAASDVAFVGGSLVAIGGHNLLEPAAVGIPMVIGPYMFNFAEITQLMKTAGAVIQVQQSQGLAQAVTSYLQDDGLRTQAGEKARRIVEQNRGALDQHLLIVQQQLATA